MYLIKPVEMDELRAHIDSLYRRLKLVNSASAAGNAEKSSDAAQPSTLTAYGQQVLQANTAPTHAPQANVSLSAYQPLDAQAVAKPIAESRASLSWRFLLNDWKLVSPTGVEIELTHLEFAFVEIITRDAGKPVKRREIISNAFKQDPLAYDMRRLEAMVSRLRKKMQKGYHASQPIKVAHSIGYIFTDPIQRE